jgi:multiple sugar transport system permease protein
VSARASKGWDAFAYVVLTAVAVTTLIPFVWTLSTSLKPEGAIFKQPPEWVPRDTTYEATVLAGPNSGKRVLVRPLGSEEHPARAKLMGDGRVVDVADVTTVETTHLHFENYPAAWSAYPFVSFWRAYANSLAVAFLVTLGQVVTSALAAYAFARMRFPGRDVLFFGYLATMMIPGAVTMIPTFALLKNLPVLLDWLFHTTWFGRELTIGGRVVGVDSYFALIAPRCFSAYGVFMLRQFFLGIPKELEEAAVIDGCGSLGVLRHVVLPLAKPALATLAIFTFMWAWGDFLWPLIVTNSDEIKTLPLLLQSFQGHYATRWNYLMAASTTALLPMVVVFLLGQRYFIEGIKLGAVKG